MMSAAQLANMMILLPGALFFDWIDWPTVNELTDVLLLRQYNTRLVVLSTAILGAASGMIGTFLLLRERSLIGDTLSHATLPGIAGAFLLMTLLGGEGKFLPGLLIGAAATGLLGVLCVLAIVHLTRLKDDAALGIVLSVFFGIGIVLLGFVQSAPGGSAAGLSTFIYGKTASIIQSDFIFIALATAAICIVCLLFYKELTIVCFDEEFAGSTGWPVTAMNVLLLALVTGVTVVGLQAVGLILMIALLIIPPAAARFWTDRLGRMTFIAAVLGAGSGWIGSSLSALIEKLPAGAIIVLVASALFAVSMLFGSARGVVLLWWKRQRSNRRIERQHLLRSAYEIAESELVQQPDRNLREDEQWLNVDIPVQMIRVDRSWRERPLRRLLRRAQSDGLLAPSPTDSDAVRLTERGLQHARRLTRNHRLWEMYLIRYADIAPSHVDRDADDIEHVLGAELVNELEALLGPAIPPSPHALRVEQARP